MARNGEEWVPLFVSTPADSARDELQTSTPLSESRRGSQSTSPTVSAFDRSYTAIPAFDAAPSQDSRASALRPRLSPNPSSQEWGQNLMQRTPSTGAAPTKHSNASSYNFPSTSHTRRRSITSATTQRLAPGGTGMERIPSLTSMMANREGKYVSPAKTRKLKITPSSLFRLLLVFALVLSLVQLGKWGFLGSTASQLIAKTPLTNFDFDGSPILEPLHIASWYDRLIAQSLSAAHPIHETFALPTSTHPRTPLANSHITLADYLTTRLGSHFSAPSSGTPTHLWLTTASKTTIRISTRHLEAFVAELDHKGRKANEAALEAAEASARESGSHKGTIVMDNLEPRRALVILCLDEGCLNYCRQKNWYCYGGFREQEEEVTGELFDSVRQKVKLQGVIETLESGRRVFVVDHDVYFRDDPVPYLGLLDEYDIQLPDTWSTTNINAGFIYLNPTKNVISLWHKINETSATQLASDPNLIYPNLLLDPKGEPRVHQSTPVSASTFSDGVITDDVYLDEAVEGGYGQSQFMSAWGGGTDVKVLDRKRFRSSTGKDGGSFGGVMDSPAIYLHCACCEDLVTTDYIAGVLGYHMAYASFPASAETGHHDSIPKFPMMLTPSSLVGTPAELAFVVGLLLQASKQTNRAFLPPLKGGIMPTVGKGRPVMRWIWSLFPVAHWAGKTGNFETSEPKESHRKVDVQILEPQYIPHAIQHLRTAYPSTVAASNAITELTDTLFLDLAVLRDYNHMIKTLSQPYFSTTLVVTVENAGSVMGKQGWELGDGWRGMEMCWEGVMLGEGKAHDGKCGKICSRRPAE